MFGAALVYMVPVEVAVTASVAEIVAVGTEAAGTGIAGIASVAGIVVADTVPHPGKTVYRIWDTYKIRPGSDFRNYSIAFNLSPFQASK